MRACGDSPDGVLRVALIRGSVGLEDEFDLQVAVVVVSRVEVGDDSGRDAQAAQDCQKNTRCHDRGGRRPPDP